MKKLIAGLFAAILTTAGLVAVSSAPAQAACERGYACPATSTKIGGTKSIRAGQSAQIRVTASTRGNIDATGTLTIKVTGPGGFEKTIRVRVRDSKAYSVNLGKLNKAGKYKVAVKFTGDEGFRDSKATSTITVKKKKNNKNKNKNKK